MKLLWRWNANAVAGDSFCLEFQKFMLEENLKLEQIYSAKDMHYSGKAFLQELFFEKVYTLA